jgi:hypothetical protein
VAIAAAPAAQHRHSSRRTRCDAGAATPGGPSDAPTERLVGELWSLFSGDWERREHEKAALLAALPEPRVRLAQELWRELEQQKLRPDLNALVRAAMERDAAHAEGLHQALGAYTRLLEEGDSPVLAAALRQASPKTLVNILYALALNNVRLKGQLLEAATAALARITGGASSSGGKPS